MELDIHRIKAAEEGLYELLGPELAQVTNAMSAEPGKSNPFLIQIPDAYTVDLPLEELSSYVARTSNAYGRVARFAGMARAEAKLAKGRFERKYKRSKIGKNDAARDASAMEACHEEHLAMVTMEAIAEIADAMENGARVASESIRKILDKAAAMNMAQLRESKGLHRDSDYSPY